MSSKIFYRPNKLIFKHTQTLKKQTNPTSYLYTSGEKSRKTSAKCSQIKIYAIKL